MQNLTILGIVCLFLYGSDSMPDKRQELMIYKKRMSTITNYGKFVYIIPVNHSNADIELYSDSDWNVGDTILFTKKR